MLPLIRLQRYIHNNNKVYIYEIICKTFGCWTYISSDCNILNDIRIGMWLKTKSDLTMEFMKFEGYLLYVYIYNKRIKSYDTYIYKLDKNRTYINSYME